MVSYKMRLWHDWPELPPLGGWRLTGPRDVLTLFSLHPGLLEPVAGADPVWWDSDPVGRWPESLVFLSRTMTDTIGSWHRVVAVRADRTEYLVCRVETPASEEPLATVVAGTGFLMALLGHSDHREAVRRLGPE